MPCLEFSWDPDKNRINQKKHQGISFEEARTVFYDENARLIFDPRHTQDETRFILLGISQKLRMLIVCHCYRENETLIRIISARKANALEVKEYERHRHA
jgi:uncharacterized protein